MAAVWKGRDCSDQADHGGRGPGRGRSPVTIQSMTNTRTEDVEATVAQIQKLEQAGCEIIRCAVPTMEAAEAFARSRSRSIFHWWQIFISITGSRLRRLRTGQTRSVSILAISAARKGSVRCGEGKGNSCADPGGRQQRVSGEAPGRKIRRRYGRSLVESANGKSTHDRGYGI